MNHCQKFEKAVADMSIPAERKSASAPNALWFLRSGVPLNRDHPQVLIAIFYAMKIAD